MIAAVTERLVLRQFDLADAEAMDKIFGDAEVMFYGHGVQTRPWVCRWLRRCQEDYAKQHFGLWAVTEKSSGAVIGYCGLSQFPEVGGQPETEIGYRLAKLYWGRGYATEAAQAVREYAFGTLQLRRLVSIIDPRNVASIRVAEKVGMRYEKDVVFEGFLDRLYSISRPPDAHGREGQHEWSTISGCVET